MKKSIRFTEHLFIPLVLACLNIGLVHLLYLFANQELTSGSYTILVALALIFLAGGLLNKKKWLLVGSVVFYLAVFLTGSLA